MSALLVDQSRDGIRAELELARSHVAELESLLTESLPLEPANGSVIRFAKYHGVYQFAAIRVDRVVGDLTGGATMAYWYVTQDGSRSSRQGRPPMQWDALLDWIGERNWDSIEVLS